MRVAKPTFLCPFQDESLSGRPAYPNRIEAKEPPCLLILERSSGGGGTNENKRRCFPSARGQRPAMPVRMLRSSAAGRE